MDSFEENLSRLQRKPLPTEWKQDLIDGAVTATAPPEPASIPEVSEMAPLPVPRRSRHLGRKWGIGLIAACWTAIALLRFTMPDSHSPEAEPLVAGPFLRNSLPEAPAAFPLLAGRTDAWVFLDLDRP